MVKRPEKYQYSGHRAYLGLDTSGLVDAEPVLRHFGGTKKRALEVYTRFVEASLGEPSQDDYYRATEGRLLGGEEFLDEIRHRVGDHLLTRKPFESTSIEDLLKAAAKVSGLSGQEVCSRSKNRKTVAVRDAVIVIGRERGISNRELAEALRVDASAVTKRVEVARVRGSDTSEMRRLRKALGVKALG